MSAVEPSIAARRSVVLCSSPKGESRSHAVSSCFAPPCGSRRSMHTVVLQGLLSVFVGSGSVSAVEPSIFVGSGSVSAVEPSIVPRVEWSGKNQGGKCKALCGKSDDEDEGDGVHGGVSPFLIRCSRYFSDKLLRPSRRSLRVNRAGRFLWGLHRPVRGGCEPPRPVRGGCEPPR